MTASISSRACAGVYSKEGLYIPVKPLLFAQPCRTFIDANLGANGVK
ncbi:hypothetical protein [Shewanella sp. YLB-07]|nr:hypothetical protein [Shewanella sp. YLB-07]